MNDGPYAVNPLGGVLTSLQFAKDECSFVATFGSPVVKRIW